MSLISDNNNNNNNNENDENELNLENGFLADDDYIQSVYSFENEKKHRYSSFAPERYNCNAKWYVDGKDFFEDAADVIESAKVEIFITDWSMNPEIYLRRGEGSTIDDRLDKILLRKAEEGVRIYVLVWYETEMAMAGTVNSGHTINYLSSLHENINCMRHPGGKTKLFWSHHQKTLIIDQQYAFVGGVDLCFGRYDHSGHPLIDNCHLNLEFPGKDYYNPRFVDFMELDKPFIDLIDRTTTPRMPWHDIHAFVDGPAAQDVAMNFIQRWNHHATKKAASKNIPRLKPVHPSFVNTEKGTCSVQIVRSISHWSTGIQRTERSIQQAYIDLIQNAQHYIYIENQYFISVDNAIVQTLVTRIIEAVENDEDFRVVVIIPITPCGQWETNSIKFVMKWQYESICRSKRSLITQLKNKFGQDFKTEQYISFHSLRKVDVLDSKVVCDQIYIHSKLMIVDDRHVVIGSANINDRSMNGDRDSEICVVVSDNNYIESQMNGKFYLASNYAHSLRVQCYLEHLGLGLSDKEQVIDPILCSNELWMNTAINNTKTINDIDFYMPSDRFKTLKDYKIHSNLFDGYDEEQKNNENRKNIEIRMPHIRGHVILYPLNFMEFESLGNNTSVENFLPAEIFQ